MISKIIRTVIGLPAALVIWPFWLGGMCIDALILWLNGEFNAYSKKSIYEDWNLPYAFLKRVWK